MMIATQPVRFQSAPHARSLLILQLVLWVLFLGPPAAALFIASGVPLMRDTGQLARDLLSTYVCPTPTKSYSIYDAPMAVCARCWGATIGLWAGYLLLRHTRQRWLGRFLGLPVMLRFVLVALPFLLWVAEIGAWPLAPYWVLLLNGAFAGWAAGLFFCSIWPHFPMNHAT